VSSAKCTAIINYPDPSIFLQHAKPETDRQDFVMCYPGTLNQHQGLDVAVRAMLTLRDKVPNFKFLIIGDGPDREKLKRMVKGEHLEDQVLIQGFVPIETIAHTMSTVDLGVVPKRKDSFGNEAFSTKIMEFMAMGVPVIVSDTRIDKYYFNDDLVQFFESDNADDLAAKIYGLMCDEQRRNSLRANALRFIDQNNWDVKKQEYFSLVDQLVTGRMLAETCEKLTTPSSIK
jgi:glycosyltransferase involved in cell wall biosynthesis